MARNASDVGIEGNHQQGLGHARPDSKIHQIRPAHHPPQEQVEPLGGAWPQWAGQQVLQAALRSQLPAQRAHRNPPQPGGKRSERVAQVPVPLELLDEHRLQAPPLAQRSCHSQKQDRQIRSHVEAVDEIPEQLLRPPGLEFRHEAGRRLAETSKQRFQFGPEEIRAPVGQRRGEQAADLDVPRMTKAMREFHGVEADALEVWGLRGTGVQEWLQSKRRSFGEPLIRPQPHRSYRVSSRTAWPSSGRISRCRANRTPCGEPGKAKIIIPWQVPAAARDIIAGLPISWNESDRNSSPNPGRLFSKSSSSTSTVLSRRPMPVPPLMIRARVPAALASEIAFRISCGSSLMTR